MAGPRPNEVSTLCPRSLFLLSKYGQFLFGGIFAIYLHFRQQKTYQGTLGTQRWTLIRSRTSHGPSMDPTGPLKWTSKLWSHFQARFAISTSYTLCNHSNHVGTLFWSLLISTKAQWTLLDLHGPLNGPQNGPCEANFRGPSH